MQTALWPRRIRRAARSQRGEVGWGGPGGARLMHTAFNIVGRVVSTLLGLILVLGGLVWVLQSFNLAFNGPLGAGGERSFMVDDRQWAAYGVIAIAIGVLQIAWSNTRKPR